MNRVTCSARTACMILFAAVAGQGQWRNVGERLGNVVSGETHEQFAIHGEVRARYESRTGTLFGQEAWKRR